MISISLVIFFYAVLYLKLFNNTEDEIEKSVVARFDVTTEYVDNDSFWWIPSGNSVIKLFNYSTAPYEGVLRLYIENNPCKNSNYVKLGEFDYMIPKENEFELIQNFEIKPLDQKFIELTVFNFDECKLDNGDSRDFGIKINGWEIDGR